ncbi:hypothetical protein B566_EDAN012729 [Ephemera danica]|nr:hypothetical protein B566_EDAN012729 [Ephemera danica]
MGPVEEQAATRLTTNAQDDAAEEQPTYFFILEDNTLSLIPAGLLDTENLWRQSQQPSGAEQDIQESQ